MMKHTHTYLMKSLNTEIGAEREVSNNLLVCLEQAQATVHQRGGRKLKVEMLNPFMATL